MRQLITLIATLILVSPVFANEPDQVGPPHHREHRPHQTLEERADGKLQFLSIVLDLTDEQLSQVRGLQAGHITAMNGIKTEFQPVLDEMKTELKEIRLSTEATIADSKEKARTVREKYEPKLEPMREALKQEKDSFDNVLVGIFTPKQQEKYDLLKTLKENQKAKKHHPPGRR